MMLPDNSLQSRPTNENVNLNNLNLQSLAITPKGTPQQQELSQPTLMQQAPVPQPQFQQPSSQQMLFQPSTSQPVQSQGSTKKQPYICPCHLRDPRQSFIQPAFRPQNFQQPVYQVHVYVDGQNMTQRQNFQSLNFQSPTFQSPNFQPRMYPSSTGQAPPLQPTHQVNSQANFHPPAPQNYPVNSSQNPICDPNVSSTSNLPDSVANERKLKVDEIFSRFLRMDQEDRERIKVTNPRKKKVRKDELENQIN